MCSHTLQAEWLSPLNAAQCLYKERYILDPVDTLCCRPCSPVLLQHPEMAVDKQCQQTVTPTSIDLLPPTPTTPHWFPPTLNLYESLRGPLPFLPGLTKMINDQPLPLSATTSLCLTLADWRAANSFLPSEIQESELLLFSKPLSSLGRSVGIIWCVCNFHT